MNNRRSTGKAALWGLILGMLIGWIPVIGAILVGAVAGKKARSPVGAILATIVPAALLGGGWHWLSSHPIKIGKDETVFGPLIALAPITATFMIGSAMVAAKPGIGRLFGLLVVIGGLTGWSGIAIAVVAASVGLLPLLFGSRRMYGLGVVLLPVMLNLTGWGVGIARMLRLI